MLKVSHVFLVDQEIDTDMKGYDLRSQRVDMDTLTNLLFNYQDGVNIERIRLYVREGLDYAGAAGTSSGISRGAELHVRRMHTWSGTDTSGVPRSIWTRTTRKAAARSPSPATWWTSTTWAVTSGAAHRRGRSQVMDILAKSSAIADSIT